MTSQQIRWGEKQQQGGVALDLICWFGWCLHSRDRL